MEAVIANLGLSSDWIVLSGNSDVWPLLWHEREFYASTLRLY